MSIDESGFHTLPVILIQIRLVLRPARKLLVSQDSTAVSTLTGNHLVNELIPQRVPMT